MLNSAEDWAESWHISGNDIGLHHLPPELMISKTFAFGIGAVLGTLIEKTFMKDPDTRILEK